MSKMDPGILMAEYEAKMDWHLQLRTQAYSTPKASHVNSVWERKAVIDEELNNRNLDILQKQCDKFSYSTQYRIALCMERQNDI